MLLFACTSHPKPSQNPHCAHAARPWYGAERIAMGEGEAVQPSFRAARSASTPMDMIGRGGSG